MGTRQLRLNDPGQVRSKITDFVGKEITIVLSNNTTIFGTLRSVNNDEILLKNKRLKNVKYPFSDIAEVYLDTKS
jgi:ribosome maturation factor RimP